MPIARFLCLTEYFQFSEDRRELKIYSFTGRGQSPWNINFSSISEDSCKFYMDLIVRNDADIDMIWDTKNKSFSDNVLIQGEAINDYKRREFFTFDSLNCDAPMSGKYLLLKSKTSTIIQFFSKKCFDTSLISKLISEEMIVTNEVSVISNLQIKKINGKRVNYYEIVRITLDIEENLVNLNMAHRSMFEYYKRKIKHIN